MQKTGIDIISNRITKLEKETIRFALNLPKNSVCLDLGAGSGFLGIILVFLHQKVYFIDQKIGWKLKILKKLFGLKNMILIQKDISKMDYKDFPADISLVYSSRFLHYLKYEKAEKLLKILKQRMNNRGRVLFSVSGIDSELGNGYVGNDIDIKNRFDFLSLENQKRFKIKEKVLLYKKIEVQELFSQYFKVKKIWQSDFGNIFIIGSKLS